MYNLMPKIMIERDVSYIGRKDTFTIEQGDKSISITQEVGGFMNKKVKPVTKKLTHTEFRPIYDAFNSLDFTKIYIESGDLVGCDGWTLRCTFSKVMSEISVQLWCPSESPDNPETNKLLQACNTIFDLFEIEDRYKHE